MNGSAKKWDLKKAIGVLVRCWESDTDFSWKKAEDIFLNFLFSKYLLTIHCMPGTIILP